jgi:hypothetical protein
MTVEVRAGSEDLLTTAEMARFVQHGFLRFESVVPEDICTAALELFARTGMVDMARPKPDSGTPLDEVYPDPSPIGAMLRLPRVQGILTSLLGPTPVYDHDWVHVRASGDVVDQHLHQDAVVDVTTAFDVQLFWFPHEVGPGEGGTGFVPGSHLRTVNEFDLARYQYLVGQKDFTGPAGSIAVFHQGLWHRGRANAGSRDRYMYKIRLNPSVPQVRHWNLEDYEVVHNAPHDHIFATYESETAAGRFRRPEPWHEAAAGRLETINRSQLWRYLTGDATFDADWYITRTERRSKLSGGA